MYEKQNEKPYTILCIRIPGLNVTLWTFQNLSEKTSKTSYIGLLFRGGKRLNFKQQIVEKIFQVFWNENKTDHL